MILCVAGILTLSLIHDKILKVMPSEKEIIKMGLVELFLIAIGLSMDAFAVAICKGLNMRKLNNKHTFIIALFFGGFQGIMPLIGWFLGKQFAQYITGFDHWIAFILLAFIGGQMILESFKKDNEKCDIDENLDLKELFMLAIATSIDALAVGITFALIPNTNIWISIILIGIITFVLSIIGVFIGNKFGARFKSKAEFAGGLILILIGSKILFEHLGLINF